MAVLMAEEKSGAGHHFVEVGEVIPAGGKLGAAGIGLAESAGIELAETVAIAAGIVEVPGIAEAAGTVELVGTAEAVGIEVQTVVSVQMRLELEQQVNLLVLEESRPQNSRMVSRISPDYKSRHPRPPDRNPGR